MMLGFYGFCPCEGIWNLGKFCLRNSESWSLESGIQLKESAIPLMINMQNLIVPPDKDQGQVPGIWRPRHGIQNPRLSLIFLHGANGWFVREELNQERERNIFNHKIQSQKLTIQSYEKELSTVAIKIVAGTELTFQEEKSKIFYTSVKRIKTEIK